MHAGIPGINTQGPSGTRVPDWRAPREYLDRELSEELKFGYVDTQGEAPQDSAGARVQEAEAGGANAELTRCAAARRQLCWRSEVTK